MLEPSCASALADDLPDLIDDRILATKAKENIVLIETFLANERKAGRLKVALQAKESISIHGHCHQKAVFGTENMSTLLEGNNVHEISSGCCGMAGSFGYEKEHYELSGKIFHDSFGTHFQGPHEKETIVACGMSCRHQLSDLKGREAKHWVEMVEVTGMK